MKNYFLVFVALLVSTSSLCIKASEKVSAKIDCWSMKALLYPLEQQRYNNVRGKVNEVLEQGTHQDLGDNCFLRTKQEKTDLQIAVAGKLDAGKLIAANIIVRYPVTVKLKDKTTVIIDQATMVANTYPARLHDTENQELLEKVSRYYVSKGVEPAYLCGRAGYIDQCFENTGFKSPWPHEWLSLRGTLFNTDKPYCSEMTCWQWQDCSGHKK